MIVTCGGGGSIGIGLNQSRRQAAQQLVSMGTLREFLKSISIEYSISLLGIISITC